MPGLGGVEVDRVGSTADLGRVTRTWHVALSRERRGRSTVGELVTAVALSAVLDTEHGESLASAVSSALLEGHVVAGLAVSGESSSLDLLNAASVGEPVDRSWGSWSRWSDRRRGGAWGWGDDVGVVEQLDSVGSTTGQRGITTTSHVALARDEAGRSTVDERVAAVALCCVLDTGVLEALGRAERGAFAWSHLGVVHSKTGKSSSADLLDTRGRSDGPTGGQRWGGSRWAWGSGRRGGWSSGESGVVVQRDGVGSTADRGGITGTSHSALSRGLAERSSVAEGVTASALSGVLETGVRETVVGAVGETLGDCHIVSGDSSRVKGSASGTFGDARSTLR